MQEKKELKVGESWQVVTNLISDQEDKTITYTSSDPEIATVSEDGMVQAKKRGTTQILVKNAASGRDPCYQRDYDPQHSSGLQAE